MNFRLADFQLKSDIPAGWHTPALPFGSFLTLVLGRNGSGKTPLVEALALALGHPVNLPPDIRTHCDSVILSVMADGEPYRIERKISEAFSVAVSDRNGSVQTFGDEREYSAWLISKLGIPERQLMGRNGTPTPPYMSVLAPMFWIDQDLGWRDLYTPLSTHNFIKDQASEVIRWYLAVPPKNRIVDTSALKDFKARLDSVHEQIQIKQHTLRALQTEAGSDWSPERRASLMARKAAALAELRRYSSVLETVSRSDTAVDRYLDEANGRHVAAQFAVRSMERRLSELIELSQELGAEVEILGMNEVAADAFRTLCGSDTCQFFRNPEESYGRRLLYLKDQMKDLEVTASGIRAEIENLRVSAAQAEQDVESLRREKSAVLERAQPDSIIAGIEALTKEIADLSFRIERGELIERENERLHNLIDLALRLEEQIAELQPRRGPSRDVTRISDVRAKLVDSFTEWLRVLNAQNISRPITFGDDLRLMLGEERFSENSSTSGSTRTRVVLAFHAAVLETSLVLNGNHPPVLVLDTPKQHELHSADLRNFVDRLRAMSSRSAQHVQLVIAATESDFATLQEGDEMWTPSFGTTEEPRYLGPARQ